MLVFDGKHYPQYIDIYACMYIWMYVCFLIVSMYCQLGAWCWLTECCQHNIRNIISKCCFKIVCVCYECTYKIRYRENPTRFCTPNLCRLHLLVFAYFYIAPLKHSTFAASGFQSADEVVHETVVNVWTAWVEHCFIDNIDVEAVKTPNCFALCWLQAAYTCQNLFWQEQIFLGVVQVLQHLAAHRPK